MGIALILVDGAVTIYRYFSKVEKEEGQPAHPPSNPIGTEAKADKEENHEEQPDLLPSNPSGTEAQPHKVENQEEQPDLPPSNPIHHSNPTNVENNQINELNKAEDKEQQSCEKDNFVYFQIEKKKGFIPKLNHRNFHGYGWQNKLIMNFLDLEDTPISLKTTLKNFLEAEAIFLQTKNLTAPTFSLPTDAGLAMISRHYKKKYQIDIFISHVNDLQNFLNTLQNQENFSRCGIIIKSMEDEGHVTPIIVNKYDKKLEILILDVLGTPSIPPFPTIIQSCEVMNIIPFCSNFDRQADSQSCRTGAAVVLRNALIDLQRFPEGDLSLSTFFPEGQNDTYRYLPDQDLSASIVKVPSLPSTWISGDQIFRGDEEEYLLRDSLSSQFMKINNPQKVSAFRRKHKKAHQCEHTLTIDRKEFETTIRKKNLETDLDKLISEWSHCKQLRIEDNGRELLITWTEIFRYNTYMLRKGFKFYQKHGQSNSVT